MDRLKSCYRQANYNSVTLADILSSRRHITDRGIFFLNPPHKEEYISYASLYKNAGNLLAKLENSGVAPGNALILQINDPKLFVTLFWACILGKIIPVPLTFGYNKGNLTKLLSIRKKLKTSHLVVEQELLGKLNQPSDKAVGDFFRDAQEDTLRIGTDCSIEGNVPKRDKSITSNDTAYIQFSSGSTGDPKGIVLSHSNIMANVAAIIECAAIKTQSEEKTMSWMPLTHDMGLIGFHLVPLFAEIDQYIMQPRRFIRNPNLWLQCLSKHRITLTASPNFGYKYLLDHLKIQDFDECDLSLLRLIFNGGEPISPNLVRKFEKTLCTVGLRQHTIFPVYGLAEASLAVSFPKPGRPLNTVSVCRESLQPGCKPQYATKQGQAGVEIVSTGRPVTGCAVRITHRSVVQNDGVIGNIEIKGANVSSGYFGSCESNQDYITHDGWLRTGDIGFLIDDGLFITGRAKDVIIIRGENYYPNDLENIITDAHFSEKLEVAIVGYENNSIEGCEIIGFLKWKNNRKPKDFEILSENVAGILVRHAGVRIDWMVAVQAIPKTTSGKIKRHALAQWYPQKKYIKRYKPLRNAAGPFAASLSADAGTKVDCAVEQKLSKIFRKIFNDMDIHSHTPFEHLALDSLGILQVHHQIEVEYPGKILISDFFKYNTIQDLAMLLKEKGNRSAEPQVNYMELPLSFFQKNDGPKFNDQFRMGIPEDIFHAIENICSKKNITFKDYFTLILLAALREISTDQVVSFQSLLNGNEVIVMHRFLLDPITDFHEILAGFRSRQINEYDINMMSFDRLKYSMLNGTSCHASIILYDCSAPSVWMDIIRYFDIRIGLSPQNGQYYLYFDCDFRKICWSALKGFAGVYAGIMQKVVEASQPITL